jgi:hypothetical protein
MFGPLENFLSGVTGALHIAFAELAKHVSFPVGMLRIDGLRLTRDEPVAARFGE